MKLLKKYLLAFAALVTSSPALDARPRLFARRCAGGGCGQVQAMQAVRPVYQPSQPRPVRQAVANLGQAVVAIPQAVVQRVAAPVVTGGCPGGVCPIK